jgi:hypothetical protein
MGRHRAARDAHFVRYLGVAQPLRIQLNDLLAAYRRWVGDTPESMRQAPFGAVVVGRFFAHLGAIAKLRDVRALFE